MSVCRRLCVVVVLSSISVLFPVVSVAGRASSSQWSNSRQESSGEEDCPTDQLVLYRVILNTYWSNETFYKHYPEYRPRPQWTKVVGVSHGPGFLLFRQGQLASPGLKELAQTGASNIMDAVTYANQGSKVLDSFYAPAIEEGVGTTQATFFADGNHSRVSMVTKIVPSPDWFIGLDALQLCSAGHWINASSIQLHPMDAGTDIGMAFTAPSWEILPQDPVGRIVHNWPKHGAASFYYPEWDSLPPIASISIVKIREYRLVKPSSSKLPLRVHDPSSDTLRDTPSQQPSPRQNLSAAIHESPDRSSGYRYDTGQTLPDLTTSHAFMAHNMAGHGRLYEGTSQDADRTKPEAARFAARGFDANTLSHQSVKSSHPTEIQSNHITYESSRDSHALYHDSNIPSHDSPSSSNSGVARNNHITADPYITSPKTFNGQNRLSHDSTMSSGAYTNHISNTNVQNSQTSSRDSSQSSQDTSPISNDVSEPATQEQPAPAAPGTGGSASYSKVLSLMQYDRELRDKLLQQQQQKLQGDKSRKVKAKKKHQQKNKLLAVVEPGLDMLPTTKNFNISGPIIKEDGMSVIDSIVQTYQREQRRKRRQKRREERRKRRLLNRLNGVAPRRGKHAVDCVVGDWSSWSACSKTCGIGEQERRREILKHARRGGKKCPLLTETTWCGSARHCHKPYFRW